MKKKMFRKYSSTALSLLMAVSMVLGSAPVQAFAEGTQVESGSTAGVSLDGMNVASSGNADQEGGSEGGILGDEDVASSGNAGQEGGTGGGSTGGGSTKPETETVTLTYDLNADGDEVTGYPDPLTVTVEKGEKVKIVDYRDMKREGYAIQGWHTNPKSVVAANEKFSIGSTHVLEEDLTLYAIWMKIEPEKPEVEVPEGAKLQEILFRPSFHDFPDGNRPNIHFEYSYKYEGETYEDITENEKAFWGETSNQVLKVLVDEKNSTPTEVTLTAINHETEKAECWTLMYQDPTTGQWAQKNDLTFTYPVSASAKSVTVHFYYRNKEDKPTDQKITKRELNVLVAFTVNEVGDSLDTPGDPLAYDQYPADYKLVYSYETLDKEGNPVPQSGTLTAADAKQVTTTPNGNETIHWGWTIPVDVVGEGVYVTLAQNVQDITLPVEGNWILEKVIGFADTYETTLYVAADKDPVTPPIYNRYIRQFTVTYTDGVENEVVFADQTYNAKKGYGTPAFNGTPTRSGYEFIGWSPAVADSVMGDAVYTAQWKKAEVVEQFRITYTDGVENEDVFADQTYEVKKGDSTPAFNGTPARSGYEFIGWSPAVADSVTEDVVYTAQWKVVEVAEQFTITYTDGVDNEVIFADQTYNVKKGESTPAFDGTPARSGYEFTGWSPAVADNVTEDAVYTAQWKKIEDGGSEQPQQPDTDDDDDDDDSYVDVPEEDVPLAEQPVTEILDENVPLAGQPVVNILDEDVPLANVPKTGDSGKWGFMTALSSLGLIVLFFTGRKKKEVL